MQRFHQFNYWISDAECVGTINGFPLFTTSIEGGSGGGPVDSYLIGPNNVVRIEVRSKGANPFLRYQLEVVDGGMMSDPGDMLEAPIPETLPHVIDYRFDADVAPFAPILDQAQLVEAKDMIDFAMSLREAIRAGDTSTLARQLRPKLEGIASRYGDSVETVASEFLPMFTQFIPEGVAFKANDLEPVAHCDGKVWEIRRKDGRPLLHKSIDNDGGSMSMSVYAARLPDGTVVVA